MVDTGRLRHFCGLLGTSIAYRTKRRLRLGQKCRMPCRIGSGSDTAPIGREEAALSCESTEAVDDRETLG